ncbi:MAG: pyridoxamine 5'-phosphate oxidase family protein, partial [Nitrospinae bacterium]|nr:pyridoxamine 5'-phosphate oxidase family protein [Nitrospinota bacterium]
MNELNNELIEQMAAEALDPESVAADPIIQFRRWYAQARSAGIPREDAMTLATLGPDGAPAARIVLYKDLSALGYAEPDFPFFTNYESDKGGQLENDARAALVFHWKPPARQVRVEGVVTKLPADISDAYFATRPRASQL